MNIPIANSFSGFTKQFGFMRGGEESSGRSVLNIHDSRERRCQQSRKPKCEGHISIIAAIDKNRLIGTDNKIPWHLPADRKRFKELTLNKPLIMGRKTYDSIGHPLSNRRNIVITRDANLKITDCEVYTSIDSALKAVENASEIMIIGGINLYKKFLPFTTTMYLTVIEHNFVGDKYFPEWDAKEWCEVEQKNFKADDCNPYDYTFITLKRCQTDR